MNMKFYKCNACGNIIAMVNDSGVPVECCGEEMEEIKANTVDADKEKHVPVFTVIDDIVHVTIGETEHPMTPEHYIEWIAIETTNGNQRKELKPGDSPKACFALCDGEKVTSVYAYCNIHGLWKKNG